MAIDSFKKVLWEAGIITEFRKTSIASLISTKPTRVDGSKVMFNRLSTADIQDYTGTINWGAITTTPVEMTFDKKKYFALTMEDLDKVQAVKDLMTDAVTDETAKLREIEDTDFLAAAAKGAGTTLGKSQAIALDKTNVYDTIVSIGTALSKKKVPRADRYCIVNAEILGLLATDDRFTKNPTVLENGIVEGQKINGLQIIQCEELPTGTILGMHKSGTGFARQLQEVEALRLQTAFADGVRGLDVYGSIVLRPESIVAAKYTFTPVIK